MDDIIAQLRDLPDNPSYSFIRDVFRSLRKTPIRRPDVVVKYGWKYLQSGAVASEVWIVYEQVYTAALDLGDLELSEKCLSALQTQFPNSSRVKILEGMMYEAKSEYTQALILYDSVLSQKPSNILALKRKACVHKAKGDINSSLSQLRDIVTVFQTDIQSWLEMSELYLGVSDYGAAAFCLEEAVLLRPSTATFHIRLAEIYYSQGGLENLLKARKHYTIARSFQSEAIISLRTLYGTLVTCQALMANKRHTSTPEGPITEALLSSTTALISQKAQEQAQKQVSSAGRSKAATGKSQETSIAEVLSALQSAAIE